MIALPSLYHCIVTSTLWHEPNTILHDPSMQSYCWQCIHSSPASDALIHRSVYSKSNLLSLEGIYTTALCTRVFLGNSIIIHRVTLLLALLDANATVHNYEMLQILLISVSYVKISERQLFRSFEKHKTLLNLV